MSLAFRCEVCDGDPDPLWRIERSGDAVVSWACNEHLASACDRLQRDWEITQLVVTHSTKRHEWAEINSTMAAVVSEVGGGKTDAHE